MEIKEIFITKNQKSQTYNLAKLTYTVIKTFSKVKNLKLHKHRFHKNKVSKDHSSYWPHDHKKS